MPEGSPFPFRRDEFEDGGPLIPTALLYWLLVGFLIAVTTVYPYVQNGLTRPDEMAMGFFIAVMILPALQLGASFLTCLAVLLFFPSRSLPLHRVGRITLWSFTGTAVGLLLMGGCCGVFSLFNR